MKHLIFAWIDPTERPQWVRGFLDGITNMAIFACAPAVIMLLAAWLGYLK